MFFAWSYEDLRGFDPGLIQHTMKPTRQEKGLVKCALKATCQGELGNFLGSRIIFSVPLNTRIIPQQVLELQLKPLLHEILGYNKIKVKRANVHKTTFITNCDTMSYKRLLSGLLDASTSFIRPIHTTFNELVRLHIYLDDLIMCIKGLIITSEF
jgi:hypothetical protein